MRSLERAVDVLEVLDDAPRGLRLTEIAKRANLHVTTTLRILTTLQGRGRVEHDGTVYRAGVGLLFGAHAYLAGSPLVLAARPILQDLASETGLAASLFVSDRTQRVVIARVEGSNPLRYELPVGERLPLHLGGGKVLAAYLPDDERDAFVESVTPFVTAGGVEVGAGDLSRDLADLKVSGFALAQNERVAGGRSVSVPITNSGNQIVAAIQVAGSEDSFPPQRIKQVAAAVRNAAQALSRRL